MTAQNKSNKFDFNPKADWLAELLRWSKWAKEDDEKKRKELDEEFGVGETIPEELKLAYLYDKFNKI
jgi:hypothetical protein